MMDGIPPAALPFAVRSPGKCILFGEHAVVYGKPELLLAIDLETHASFAAAERTELNHDPEAATHHPYFHAALARWPPASPVGVGVISRVPKAAGLGSSAAFTAAITAGLSALQGGVERGELAQRAFDAERTAQGIGSPGDTTATVAGGYVAVNGGGHDLLWSVAAGDQRWTARRVSDPRWVWVLGYTGVPRDTATTVRAVAERLKRPDGPRLLDSLEEVARRGIASVEEGDRHEVGQALRQNHQVLRELGVSHPRIEELLEEAGPASEGAKLTGAGAGGSVVVLPREGREAEVARRIAKAGGVAFVVRPAVSGTHLVE